MTNNEGATSPAQNAPAAPTSGDGTKKAAANVSQAEAIRMFTQAYEAKSKATTPPAADTSATPAQEAPAANSPDNSPPAAESAPAASPEVQAQPEAAAPETPEAEAEGDAETDPVLSPESQTLDEKTKEKIQRRIDREVGKRKAQEAKTQQLEAELNNLKAQFQQIAQTKQAESVATNPLPDDPLPDIKDPKALADFRKQAKETANWAEEILDRDDIDQGITLGDKTYSKADIKGILRNARRALDDAIPAKQEFFQAKTQLEQQRQQFSNVAKTKFPFMADPNATEVKQARSFFDTHMPQVLAHPTGEFILGAYILGMKTLFERDQAAKQAESAKPSEANKAAAAPPKAPPVKPKAPSDQAAVSTAGAPPRQSATQGRQIVPPRSTLDSRGATAFLAQMDQLRNSRGT